MFLWSPVIFVPDNSIVPLVDRDKSTRNIFPLKYNSLWYNEKERFWSVNAKLVRVSPILSEWSNLALYLKGYILILSWLWLCVGLRCLGIYPENLWNSKNLLKLKGKGTIISLCEYFLFFLNLKFREGSTKGTLSTDTSSEIIYWVFILTISMLLVFIFTIMFWSFDGVMLNCYILSFRGVRNKVIATLWCFLVQT